MLHGSGTGIAFRNVEWQSILKHPAPMQKAYRSIAQRIGVELAGSKTVRIPPQARRGKVDGLFEIPVLRLEMMRRQIHPFRPHDSRQQLHAVLTCSIGAAILSRNPTFEYKEI